MKKITKAVIPVAGYGTRFLPASKSIPKEMFPIIDKPTIHWIVEEAYKSGITDLLFIVSRNKHSILNYFDYNKELNDVLAKKKKFNEIKKINEITEVMNIQFVIQKEQLGLGHAILQAEKFINNEPFAVLLGDDIVIPTKKDDYALKQCIQAFNKTKKSIVGVQEVKLEDVSKYGIVKPKSKKIDNVKESILLTSLIEKPEPQDAPSKLAVLGRYVLTPNIFKELKNTKKDIRDEIELTDAINSLCKKESVYAKCFSGRRFDIGLKKGYVEATIYLALRDKEISDEIKNFIRNEIKI